MDNPAILDMDYPTFSKVQTILENPSTMKSFLEVLPPDCTRDNILITMDLESQKYYMTPAKYLLQFLGSKQYRVSDLITWFEAINLERALILLRRPMSLSILVHPEAIVRLKEGETLLLKCYATSYPPPEYQWFKGEEELLLEIDKDLCIANVRMKDAGIYTCLVTCNTGENRYSYLYSNSSYVEIIPSEDLHAIAPISRDSQPSFSIESGSIYMPGDKLTLGISSAVRNEISQCQPYVDLNNQTRVDATKRGSSISICKQPYIDGKVPQGMAIRLICEAVCDSPVNYQWWKDGNLMHGETHKEINIHNTYPDSDTGDTKWEYQCEVFNEHSRVLSRNVVVELDEVKDTTPFTARDKVAFMVANDTYDHLEDLYKPARDVIDVSQMLSSMGFKIFPLRNLTLTEMRNAFFTFCKDIRPGSYVVFFFSGHGFEVYGQTYLQTVDSSPNHLQQESVCSEFILQCLQVRKPSMVVLLIDTCRKLPPNINEDLPLHNVLPPGKIFLAKMKNNTIYGYSTSFLSASHESDNEENSIFVKHLKKYLTLNKSIQEILMMVQADLAKDPLVKNLQNPTIKSTLAQRRKLCDPLQDLSDSNVHSSIFQWCDIKSNINVLPTFALIGLNAELIIEFHHHMKVFCNGVDVNVYLFVEPIANLRILNDMEINMTFNSDMREHREEAVIMLKYCSKNAVRSINFSTKLSEITKLQLSVNHLQSHNIDSSNIQKFFNLKIDNK